MYTYTKRTPNVHSSVNLVCLSNRFVKNCLASTHGECKQLVTQSLALNKHPLMSRCIVTAPPPNGFPERKVYHNFVLILYNFVHRVPKFVHRSLLRYQQVKFGRLVTCSPPPQMKFQHKKLDHKFVLILYNFVH